MPTLTSNPPERPLPSKADSRSEALLHLHFLRQVN